MAFRTGTRLGPYEIVALLGAGGMGEVYRARDTRLDRAVAIKVLSPETVTRPGTRERFDREARAISSLNHPHICTLYDIGHHDGIDFLIMEYLEGETLQQRLARGPLPLENVLRLAIPLVNGLAQAHTQGVFHRDLKPANIMITESGPKLLDFGLAKLREREGLESGSAAVTQTASSELTQPGTILGTLQYMAPEQLEGKEADARTDIFALGAVLYEMATGRKVFEAKSRASLIAAILEREPQPISSLNPPSALDHAVLLCLAKDPRDRWQNAHDLQRELEWIAEGGGQPMPLSTHRPQVPWIIAGLIMLLAVALFSVFYFTSLRREDWRAVKLAVPPPDGTSFDVFALSPDGRRLAFTATDSSGVRRLWLRPLDSLTSQLFQNTEGAAFPFWSPDSRSIGFFAAGKLKRTELSGGPPQVLATAYEPKGGSWSQDDVILFSPSHRDPIFQVSARGGEPHPVTVIDLSHRENSHRWPQFLPDRRHFIYFIRSDDEQSEGIYLGSLDAKSKTRLIGAHGYGVYVTGQKGEDYIFFLHERSLFAQPFDAARVRTTGGPFRLLEGVAGEALSGSRFSVAQNGVLAYQAASHAEDMRLVWLDRNGKEVGTLGPPGRYINLSLSADGKRVAADRINDQTHNTDIWVFNVAGGNGIRLTFDTVNDLAPVWSPDGSRVMFNSAREGRTQIYSRLSSGAGTDQLLIPSIGNAWPWDWSRDGKYILYYDTDPKTGRDLWVLPLEGERKPIPVVQTNADESHGQISPDGRWIAYQSNESGQGQIYVAPFAPQTRNAASGRWQISTNGGTSPRWRRDGQELFYISTGKLMGVKVKTTSVLETSTPSALFQIRSSVGFMPYDVSADGNHFLVALGGEERRTQTVTMILDWTTLQLNR